jgi:quercetin dioxygenase-like cupin family protein
MGMELVVHPLLLAPGEGDTVVDRPEKTLRILAELDDVIVTWFRYAPGEKGPDAHVHHRHTDAFYVLESELEVSLGPEPQTVRATPGTFAAAPPDVVHTFRNASDSDAIFLNLHAPSSGFGDHIRGRNPSFDQHDPPPDGGRPFADAVFTRPEDAETIRSAVSTHRVLCDLPQLTAIDMTFQPEFEGVDPHTHPDHVDAFYVLEGEVEFRAGDELHPARPGFFLVAPRNSVHGFRVAGAEPMRCLNLHAPPAGFLDRLRKSD